MGKLKLFGLCLILAICLNSVSSARILAFLPIATKSHRNVIEPLIQALAKRGHDLTVVSPGPPYKKPVDNIKEIVPIGYPEIFETFQDPFEQRRIGGLSRVTSIDFIYEASKNVHKTGALDALANEKFDLILVNGMFNSCFDCFLHKFGVPTVMVITLAAPSFVTELVGNHLPPSFVPYFFLEYNDDMNFKERFINTALDLFLRVFAAFLMGPKLDEVNKELFGADCPPSLEIEQNVSLILSNSFVPLTTPRPLLPDVVEVGGMHCRPAQALPKDLDEFLSGAEHGFVYFSMGSVVKTDFLPEATRQKFLNVFGRLKQRVIWKWNSGEMENLPKNVRVNKWLPQQDILGHPKIKVFMTHGGLLSTQEAAYHGVPLLGMPVFADQDLNMHQAEASGYALTQEILDIDEKKLEETLNKLIYDPQYSTKAKQLSAIFRNQLQTPVERAVFWTEYVIRHNGAFHLRSAARKLNFFQYHSMDVAAFLLVMTIFILVGTFVSCRFCCRKLLCKRSAAAKNLDDKKRK